MAFLFRGNRRHETDGRTGATLNVASYGGLQNNSTFMCVLYAAHVALGFEMVH